MKKLLLLGALTVAATGVAQATLYSSTYSSSFNNGGAIPDGNPAGWFDTRTIDLGLSPTDGPTADGTTSAIVDVNVRLNISGGYNGDLYGYLVHSSGFAVLLNRSGKTSGDVFGYGDPGYNITLDGQASGHAVTDDIHQYSTAGNNPTFSGGRLTGTWLEDGRNTNPSTVTDASLRTATLDSLNTLSANGTWTLFLADLAGGDASTVVSWGLDISVVPEPVDWALGLFGGALGLTALIRAYRRPQNA